MRYAFISDHRTEFRVVSMCRVLKVHRSGFYAWLNRPDSNRTQENERLRRRITFFWEESDRVYGSPRIYADLREDGEHCGKNRVARIMRENGIQAERGLKKRVQRYGKPSQTADNLLGQEFSYEQPDQAWVIDITYVRTFEGWLYLAVVMDLYSRRIIGWSMQKTLHRDLVLQALLMAIWRRQTRPGLIIHSDQGSQFGSDDWVRFCDEHGLQRSMSRRGNCYDNAAVEAFFSSLKKERIRRRVYRTRAQARADIFDYIEVFYNKKRRHEYLGGMSPVEYEQLRCAG